MIKLDGNTNPRIEQITEFEESIFKYNYINSIKKINDIIEKNGVMNNSDVREKKYNFVENKNNYDECYNNIIIFEGDRGTGKTSCMLSISQAYKEVQEGNVFNKISRENEFIPLIKSNSQYIEVNELIDPSVFNSESIIEILVVQILKKFKEKVQNHSVDDGRTGKMITLFKNVFSNLKIINNSNNYIYKDEVDDIEKLLELSSSVELRKNLKELIDEYFYVSDEGKKFLLIQIDDLDLNLKNSNKIMEDIRKYLIIPNIIITISLKLDQYKKMLDHKNREEYTFINETDIDNMSKKYIEKLFPSTNIILMPDMISESESDTNLINDKTIERYIIDNIYNKTGYKFIKPRFGVNEIVPKTLREMNIFISYLDRLEKAENNDDKLKNFELLVEYFINIKYKIILKEKDYKFIVDLYNNRLTKCNYDVIMFLIDKMAKNEKFSNNNKLDSLSKINEYIIQLKDGIDSESKSIKNNLEFMKTELKLNYSQANLSLGKLLRMIKISQTYIVNDYDIEVMSALKLIYSFLLYKAQMKYLKSFSTEDSSEICMLRRDFKNLLAMDIYDEYQELYDLKNQLYKIKGKIKLDKNINQYIREKIAEQDISNVNKIKMQYLLYSLLTPYSSYIEQTYLLREDDITGYGIVGNQKHFYFNGTLAITKIFYSDDILDEIRFDDTENVKQEIMKKINSIIEEIPFYNIEFLIEIFDWQVKQSQKTRVNAGEIDKFTIEFIELLNKGVNNVKERISDLGITENKLAELPTFNYLKDPIISKVIVDLKDYIESERITI